MGDSKQPPSRDLPAEQGSEESVGGATEVGSSVDVKCILFGRGKACNNHSANKRMRLVLEGYRDRYYAAGRGGKQDILLQAYRQLVQEGMKFLKQEEGIDGWIEANADEAIEKLGNGIRNIRKGARSHGDGSSIHPSQAAKPSVPSTLAPKPTWAVRVPAAALPTVSGGSDVAMSLTNASLPNAANTDRYLPSAPPGGLQPMSESTLPLGSNPLHSPSERVPTQLSRLYPGLSSAVRLPDAALPTVSRGSDVATSLTNASLPNAANTDRYLPSVPLGGLQPISGSTLPLGSSPLYSPSESIPTQLSRLYPGLSASLELAAATSTTCGAEWVVRPGELRY